MGVICVGRDSIKVVSEFDEEHRFLNASVSKG